MLLFLSKNDTSCQSIATTLVENAACSVVLGARLRALSYKYHTQNNSEMAIPAVCADNLYTAQHNKFSKTCETKLYSFALTKLYWCALSQSSGHRSSKRVKWAGWLAGWLVRQLSWTDMRLPFNLGEAIILWAV